MCTIMPHPSAPCQGAAPAWPQRTHLVASDDVKRLQHRPSAVAECQALQVGPACSMLHTALALHTCRFQQPVHQRVIARAGATSSRSHVPLAGLRHHLAAVLVWETVRRRARRCLPHSSASTTARVGAVGAAANWGTASRYGLQLAGRCRPSRQRISACRRRRGEQGGRRGGRRLGRAVRGRRGAAVVGAVMNDRVHSSLIFRRQQADARQPERLAGVGLQPQRSVPAVIAHGGVTSSQPRHVHTARPGTCRTHRSSARNSLML